MFQIGLPEIILIALVVLVLVKPKELPGMLRTLGRMAAGFRSMREDFLKEMRGADEESGGKDRGKKRKRGARPRS